MKILFRILKKISNCLFKKDEKEAGWTFIEIMVTILIIALLTGIVGVAAFNLLIKANPAVANQQISNFETAIYRYRMDCKNFPSQEQGLKALVEKPVLEPVPDGWAGPYLDKKEVPKDPWGHEYVYIVPGPGGLPFGIYSYGNDGVDGGEGEGADIKSWEN